MKRTRLAIVFIVLIAVAVGLWWAFGTHSSDSSSELVTSGFIEARDVSIAVEVGGRIADITADEGETVAAGMPLVMLDDSLLELQEKQAEAAVKLAEASFQQAIVVRDGAEKAWQNARDIQGNPLELAARITAARGELEIAELELTRVEEIETGYVLATAGLRRDIAAKFLENLKSSHQELGVWSLYQMRKELYPAERELALAELDLDYQQELAYHRTIAAELLRNNAEQALQNLMAIRDNPQEINAASDQAHTVYQKAAAAVEVAERQLVQAEVSRDAIQAQMERLTVTSPVSGMVAGRYAEVGEIAQPGASIMTVTDLTEVTLTAYVPESKIGLVQPGQHVLVSVDSYPDESFTGRITHISSRALFTPKNVQLQEEREKMVFGVKISLENAEQKLKPGMPADARIPVNTQ